MEELVLDNSKELEILCVGAHPDDIEIGCGGTLIKWLESKNIKLINWIVFSSDGIRKKEAKKSAELFTDDKCELNLQINNYKDSFLPYEGAKVKDYFLSVKDSTKPDIIFTHYRNDLHQDHRFISNLTHNIYRDHLIFEYEIPKYDGDLGNPNIFIQLDGDIITKKFDLIDNCFKSQKDNLWFSKEKLSSINIVRGIESNNANIFSEAFYCNKTVIK